MSRLNNIKIGHKLMICFGLILVLLITISATGYQGLSKADSGFNTYRDLARDSVLAGRLQANFLMLQSSFSRHLLTQSPIAYDELNKRIKLMHRFLDQSKDEIQKPERVKLINEITVNVREYEEAIEDVMQLIKKRQELFDQILEIRGPAMRKIVTQLRNEAHNNQQSDLSHFAGDLQENLILGRLYLLKYLQGKKIEDYKASHDQLSEMISKNLKAIHRLRLSAEQKQKMTQLENARSEYVNAMEDISNAIENEKSLIKNKLEKLGPTIADHTEQVKLSVIRDQDTLGPELKKSNANAVNWMSGLALCAILLGLTISILFSRMMSYRLEEAVAAANLIASGNLKARKPDDAKDEIGQLQHTLYQTSESLKEMIQGIGRASSEMNHTSAQLATMTEQAELGAQKQLQETDLLSSAITEMTASATEVAENTHHTATATESARQDADNSYQLMAEAIDQIHQLQASVTETENRLSQVQLETQNIGTIVEVNQSQSKQTYWRSMPQLKPPVLENKVAVLQL